MEVSTKRWICSDICRRCSDPCRFAGYVGEDEEGMETRFTDSSCGCQNIREDNSSGCQNRSSGCWNNCGRQNRCSCWNNCCCQNGCGCC